MPSKDDLEPIVKSKKPGKTRITLKRTKNFGQKFMIVLGMAVLAAVTFQTLKGITHPIITGAQATMDTCRLDKQLQNEKARRDALKRRIIFLKTSNGVESEARKLGYVKNGEISIQQYKTGDEDTADKKKAAEEARKTTGLRGFFHRLAGG